MEKPRRRCSRCKLLRLSMILGLLSRSASVRGSKMPACTVPERDSIENIRLLKESESCSWWFTKQPLSHVAYLAINSKKAFEG